MDSFLPVCLASGWVWRDRAGWSQAARHAGGWWWDKDSRAGVPSIDKYTQTRCFVCVCMCVHVRECTKSVCSDPAGSLSVSLSLLFSRWISHSILSPGCSSYSPALRGARGFGFPSWVRRFLPFLISWRCFHFLFPGRTEGPRGGTSFTGVGTLLSTWSTAAFFRAQTCSQIWSTVLRLGWSTSCMKSRYQSFWLVMGDAPPLRGSNLTGASEGRLGAEEDVEGTTSKVIPSRVWVKPCSMAWHW